MRTAILHDATFPDLQAALDPRWAAKAFSDMLEAHGFPTRMLECRVERVRIKRGRKALIGYRLTGADARGHPIDQRVMLSLFPDGSPARLSQVKRDTALVRPTFGPPTATISALGGQAWFFPNDRKVHGIDALMRSLPPVIVASGRVIETEVVHYVPEQGCTVRVATDDGRAFYGKCRADDRCASAMAVHEAAKDGGALRIAAAIAHDPVKRIFWQRAVAGKPLDPADVRARPAYWAPLICDALSAFETMPVGPPLTSLDMGRVIKTIESRVSRSATEMPMLADRLGVVVDRLARARPNMAGQVLLHCDLHPANLLWDGTSFALIDLDTAARGPLGFDHGSLVAALIHKAIEAQARDAGIDRMVGAFRDAFGKNQHFDWFVAASLIGERLYRCGTRMKSPSALVRERLLEQAERLVVRHG
jgi:Phosphotransferase enzyme family